MKTIKNKSITLNLIPSLSVSFKEASFDVPLVEEGGIYHFLLETLQRLGLTPMESFLAGLCIASLFGYIFCQLINSGAYHSGWVRGGTDKLLMNHKEALEWRAAKEHCGFLLVPVFNPYNRMQVMYLLVLLYGD